MIAAFKRWLAPRPTTYAEWARTRQPATWRNR